MSNPEHIGGIVPRVMEAIPKPFEARFRLLWSAYRQALAQPFGKDRQEDEQIRAKVDAAFDALDQLSKETP